MATPLGRSRPMMANSRSVSRSDKCGGRLVHHQDARVLRQRLGDLDHLLLRDAERVHRGARVDIEADQVEHAARLGIEPLAVDETRHAAAKLASEKDVLRDVEIGNEGEFLEDDRDAEPARIGRRRDLDGPAVVQQFAGVGAVGAAQHLHQGRFSGAVLAEQHVHFAGAIVERDVVQRLARRETASKCRAARTVGRPAVASHGRLRRDVHGVPACFTPHGCYRRRVEASHVRRAASRFVAACVQLLRDVRVFEAIGEDWALILPPYCAAFVATPRRKQ